MGGAAGPTTTAEHGGDGLKRSVPKAGPPPSAGPGRRVRTVLTLVLAGSLALGGFGLWVLYGSTWLRVEHVEVGGVQDLPLCQHPLAAAVPAGTPMASVDQEGVERWLRERLRRIESVDVSRSWPHTVQVRVTEREPAVLLRRGGEFVEVDEKGVRYATVAKAPAGVPVVVMDVDSDSPGARRFGPEQLRRAAAKVAAALPAPVHRDTRTIRVRSFDSITVELADGRTVMWGSGERGKAKAESLRLLMKAAKDARHFDVSVPSAPAAAES